MAWAVSQVRIVRRRCSRRIASEASPRDPAMLISTTVRSCIPQHTAAGAGPPSSVEVSADLPSRGRVCTRFCFSCRPPMSSLVVPTASTLIIPRKPRMGKREKKRVSLQHGGLGAFHCFDDITCKPWDAWVDHDPSVVDFYLPQRSLGIHLLSLASNLQPNHIQLFLSS